MPTKETLVHTIQMPGTPEKSKVKDFALSTHERVLQVNHYGKSQYTNYEREKPMVSMATNY